MSREELILQCYLLDNRAEDILWENDVRKAVPQEEEAVDQVEIFKGAIKNFQEEKEKSIHWQGSLKENSKKKDKRLLAQDSEANLDSESPNIKPI